MSTDTPAGEMESDSNPTLTIEWVQTQLQTIQTTIDQQGAIIKDLLAAKATAPEAPAAPIVPHSRRKRHRLGQPYNGKKELFSAWRNTMLYVLDSDREFIGDNHDQWVFLWVNLKPSVQVKVATYYVTAGPMCGYNPADFLAYLQSIFLDPHEKAIARGLVPGGR